LQIFSTLLKVKAKQEILSKIRIIEGDLAKSNFDISNEEEKLLKSTTMIFHFAATVKFTETFKNAINLNVKCVRDLLNFSLEMNNLKIFCHASTIYCNINEKILEEKIYETSLDPEIAIKIAESLNEKNAELFFEKIVKNSVCSYDFTKGLAEKLIQEFSKKFKIQKVVFRFGIVSPTISKPFVGWNYSENALEKLIDAAIFGLQRSINADGKAKIILTPGDYLVNNLMMTTWHSLQH
jgi:fatty acyl-CoA reductase